VVGNERSRRMKKCFDERRGKEVSAQPLDNDGEKKVGSTPIEVSRNGRLVGGTREGTASSSSEEYPKESPMTDSDPGAAAGKEKKATKLLGGREIEEKVLGKNSGLPQGNDRHSICPVFTAEEASVMAPNGESKTPSQTFFSSVREEGCAIT